MAQGRYGYRYPGGHSVIDKGWVRDDETLRVIKVSHPKKKPNGLSAGGATNRFYDDLKAGVKIYHDTLGRGAVLGKTDAAVTLKFDSEEKPRSMKKSKAVKCLKVLDTNLEKEIARKEKIVAEKRAKKQTAAEARSAQTRRLPKTGWAKCADSFLGCHAKDSKRGQCVITDIKDDRISLRSFTKKLRWEMPYPDALLDGSLELLESPNVALIVHRQRLALKLVKTRLSQS